MPKFTSKNKFIGRLEKGPKKQSYLFTESINNETFGNSSIPLDPAKTELNERLILDYDGVSVGDSFRSGQSVTITKIYWSFSIVDFEADLPTFSRHMLLWDRFPNGASSGSGGSISDFDINDLLVDDDVDAPFNIKNTPRFKILRDDHFVVGPPEIQNPGYKWKGVWRGRLKQTYDNSTNRPLSGRLIQVDMNTGEILGCVLDGFITIRYEDD